MIVCTGMFCYNKCNFSLLIAVPRLTCHSHVVQKYLASYRSCKPSAVLTFRLWLFSSRQVTFLVGHILVPKCVRGLHSFLLAYIIRIFHDSKTVNSQRP